MGSAFSNPEEATQKVGQYGQLGHAVIGTAAGVAQTGIHGYANTRDAFHAHVLKKAGGSTGGYSGGGATSYFNGGEESSIMKDLKDYRASASAKSKEDMVRNIAGALKAQKLNVDPDADLDTIVAQLKDQIPNPRTNGKSFREGAQRHENACKAIAKALNDQFTPGAKGSSALIDTGAGAAAICRRVAEIVHGMSTGMQTEFLAVQAQVTTAMRNLAALDALADKLHDKSESILLADASDETRRDALPMVEAHKRLLREREIVMLQLQGLLDTVILPASEELKLMMAEQSDMYSALKKADLVPGSTDFGQQLADVLSGLGTLSGVAARTQKALNTVGSTMDDYVNSSSWTDFRNSVNDMSDASKAPEVARAMEQLQNTFDLRQQISADADSPIARLGNNLPDDGALGAGEGYSGGAPSEMDRRIKKRDLERRLILKQYFERTRAAYDKFLRAVGEVGPRLGRDIPVSDSLLSLKDALQRMENISNEARIDFNLIGMYDSPQSRARREAFLNALRLVKSTLASLTAGAGGEHFRAMEASIDELVRTIDYYSEAMKKAIGGAAGGDAAGGDAAVTGGASLQDLTESELNLAEASRSSLDLKSSIKTFTYFIFAAGVRENLKASSAEIDEYGAKYEEILGDAVAGRLKDLSDEQKATLETSSTATATKIGTAPNATGTPDEQAQHMLLVTMGVPANDTVKCYEAAKSLIELQYKTKKEFYEVLQAMDMYMKAFASGIARHPDDVMDIKKELDGVTFIGKWFEESTGDRLTQFFEMSRALGGANAGSSSQVFANINNPAQGTSYAHYYARVAAGLGRANSLAPGAGGAVSALSASDMQKEVGDALRTLQSLKNLVNAFARIGAKFGGEELKRKTFMSPTDMWRRLTNYIKVSAVSTGADVAADGATQVAGAPAPQFQAVAGNLGAGHFVVYPTPVQDNGALVSNWTQENVFFGFIIKAMAAKILTVVGTFDLFERPEPLYDLTPTRMILGGYSDAPEVIPAATELYFRMPRLAEFYRDLFAFDNAPGAANTKISFLPELGGTFSKLISWVFVKAKDAAKSGDYSETEVEGLVDAINTIYNKYKEHGDQCCRKAVQGFVAEINRRYAIIKREDYTKFEEGFLTERYRDQGSVVDQYNDYAILPGEEEGVLPGRMTGRAPSSRFAAPAGAAAADLTWLPGKYKLDANFNAGDSMWAILQDFRARISAKLDSDAAKAAYGKVSYSSVIDQAKRAIEKASEPRDRMETVLRLMQGSEMVSGTNQGRALIFHETVVLALNALTALTRQIRSFREQVTALDIVDINARIVEYLAASNAVDGGALRNGLLAALDLGQANYIQQLGVNNNTLYQGPASGGNTDGTWNQASINGQGQGQDETAFAQRVARYLTNRGQIMQDLVLTLFQLTSDFGDLVSIRFPGSSQSKLHLDFSGLRSLIEGLMDNTRHFLNHFRGMFDEATIKKFEGSTDGTQEGTLYWLEANLVDQFIKGDTTLAGAPRGEKVTFNRLSQKVNGIVVELTKKHEWFMNTTGGAFEFANAQNQTPTNAAAAGGPYDEGALKDALYDQYGRTFSRLVFWDAVANNSGVQTGAGSNPLGTAFPGLVSLIRGAAIPGARPDQANPPLGVSTVPPGTAPTVAGDTIDSATPVYAADAASVINGNRSMLMVLNQLIARYIEQYFDAPSGKMYQGLIDAFASGAFSQSIVAPAYSQPDVYQGNIAFGQRGDPTAQSVLFTSLTTIMQRITRDRVGDVSKHLTSTLAEVPTYMKESYRATLPIFSKMFGLLLKQGEFIKIFVERAQVQCGRPDLSVAIGGANDLVQPALAAGAVVAVPVRDVTLRAFGDAAGNRSDAVKASIFDAIGGITSAAFTLSGICDSVQAELADEPTYLETAQGSIQAYRARYGKMPLMPQSLSMFLLRADLDAATNQPVLVAGSIRLPAALSPVQAVNSPDFQVLYGMRGLLGGKTGTSALSQMPGAKAVLDTYNAGVTAREKVDEGRFGALVEGVATTLKYLTTLRIYAGAIVASTYAFGKPAALAYPVGANTAPRVYSLRASVARADQILSVVDSSYQEDKIRDMVGTADAGIVELAAAAASGMGNRDAERVNNLIDMNIMPVNVHGLMRSMALAPLYNYGYTFEQMVCLFLGEDRTVIRSKDVGGGAGAPPNNTKQFFLKMLVDPYAPVDAANFGDETNMRGTAGFGNRMFRGDNGIGMGRPKMLSDQIFNKVLFGSIWPSKRDYDEAGPSGLTSRGREGWGGPGMANVGGMADFRTYYTTVTRTVPNMGVGTGADVLAFAARAHAATTDLGNAANALSNLPQGPFAAGPANTAMSAVRDAAIAVANAFGDVGVGGAAPNFGIRYFLQQVDTMPANANANALRAGPLNAGPALDIINADVRSASGNGPGEFNDQLRGAAGNNTLNPVALAIALGATDAEITAAANAPDANAAQVALGAAVKRYYLRMFSALRQHEPAIASAMRVPVANQNVGNPAPILSAPESTQLTFLDNAQEGMDRIVEVAVGNVNKQQLQAIGLGRFNTAVIRNITLIANVQRVIRKKLSREMAEQRTILQRGSDLVAPGATEFEGSEVLGDKQYFSERSVLFG